jgi:sulfide:quinone oxidoreductase
VRPAGRFRAVIAGAGVAGLEALLALRALAGERVEIDLLAPNDAFEFRPLFVAEPFGLELRSRLELEPILAEAGARHIREALASVDPAARSVRTASGDEIGYDALLVALGARPSEAVPGALTFASAAQRGRFGELLTGLGRRGSKRLAFVVPAQATWSIAAYELALLTAAESAMRGLKGVELSLITHESEPLELLGAPASQLVSARLEEAGVELRRASAPLEFADGMVRIRDAEPIPADHAVALPGLEVAELPGLSQGPRGFVRTDVRMHVEGLEHVWAAGDVTSFPIKQGGLAAQQADVAARSIAVLAGVHAPALPFQPVLRAALITGGPLEFLRSGGSGGTAAGARALWWPPSKIAGSYLGPLLARAAGEAEEGPLFDLEPSSEPEADEAERRTATQLLLAAADADARAGDEAGALRWLGLVEELNLVLPADYVARRHEWRRALDPTITVDAVAGRIEPSFESPEAGISDLQRRLGWLREFERQTEGEMTARLGELDAGLEHLKKLSRGTGALPRERGRGS